MNEPGIDLTGKLIIKVALGDDIRRILITNEDITYDELVLMMQRVYRGKLNSTDDIVIKYKDEDNDLITIFDSSDLSFATQCSRILKITLFVNSKPEPLQTDEIKMIKTELKHIRDRCTKLLDRLDDREVPDFPSSTVDSTTNKTSRIGNTSDSPRRAAAPSPRMQTPTNTAGSKEFDPFSRQRSTDDHQEKVLSSFNFNNDNERSGTPDSISSIGSAGQRQAGQPTPQPTSQGPPQPTPQGPPQPNQRPPQPTPQGGPQPAPQGLPQQSQPQQPVQPGMYPGGPSGAQKMTSWQPQSQQQNASGQPFPGQQQGFPPSSQHSGLPGQQQHSPASQGQSVPTSASTASSFVPPGSPYQGYSQPGQPGGAMQYGAQQQSGQYGGLQPGQTGPPGQTGHPSGNPQQQQQPPQGYYLQQPQQPGPPGPPGPGGNNPYARQGPGYGVGYPKPAASYPQGYQ